MVSAALLFGLLLTATVTDVRWGTIYNWTTYPGMLLALLGSGAASLLGLEADGFAGTETPLWGFVPFDDSLFGLLACGAVMVCCYVFLPGIGGGDLKLIAMMGAFLGVYSGLEAMLWTFVVGACMAVAVLIWRTGLLTLLRLAARYAYGVVKLRTLNPLSQEQREPLKTDLYLSPSALAAVVIVYFQLMELF
ncbi:MAG: A24 family peptidase [Pirellulaceae bacterium]